MEQNRRLISLDKVLSDIEDLTAAAAKDPDKYMRVVGACFDTFRKHLESFPTVEAVRCKDCKHSDVWGTEKQIGCEATYSRVCLHSGMPGRVKDEDFCSYGERRVNGKNT